MSSFWDEFIKRYSIRSLTPGSTSYEVYSPCPVFFTISAGLRQPWLLTGHRALQQGWRVRAVCLPQRYNTGLNAIYSNACTCRHMSRRFSEVLLNVSEVLSDPHDEFASSLN